MAAEDQSLAPDAEADFVARPRVRSGARIRHAEDQPGVVALRIGEANVAGCLAVAYQRPVAHDLGAEIRVDGQRAVPCLPPAAEGDQPSRWAIGGSSKLSPKMRCAYSPP